jgi:hypothetical protein
MTRRFHEPPKPEPMIFPAPFGFCCPDCGEDVHEDDPVGELTVPGERWRWMFCQDCAMSAPMGVCPDCANPN